MEWSKLPWSFRAYRSKKKKKKKKKKEIEDEREEIRERMRKIKENNRREGIKACTRACACSLVL